MSRKHIPQTEARALKAQVKALTEMRRQQLEVWAGDYPGGVHIATLALDNIAAAKVETARRLGYAIVATSYNSGQLSLYAVKP